jgi:hypothetical protein
MRRFSGQTAGPHEIYAEDIRLPKPGKLVRKGGFAKLLEDPAREGAV